MGVTIRRAGSGNEAAFAELNGMVQAIHVDARPDIFVPVSAADLGESFRSVQAVWLAEVYGAPVDCLLVVIHDRPATQFSAPRRWCEIDQLGVVEATRGQGVARAFVGAAIGWAGKLGITRVSAQCWSFNFAAQGAFARLGFEPMIVRLERHLGDRNRPTAG